MKNKTISDLLSDEILKRMIIGNGANEMPDREVNQVCVLIAEDKTGKEGLVGTFPPFLFSDKDNAELMFESLKPQLLAKARQSK